jgi:hypothetical protein
LQENEYTYRLLFKGKKAANNSTDSIIARFVEKHVLMRNHEEILSIIKDYRYLAETDADFEGIMKDYIRHVKIYKALLDAGNNEYAGIAAGAGYPGKLDEYFYDKTNQLQKKLERMKF